MGRRKSGSFCQCTKCPFTLWCAWQKPCWWCYVVCIKKRRHNVQDAAWSRNVVFGGIHKWRHFPYPTSPIIYLKFIYSENAIKICHNLNLTLGSAINVGPTFINLDFFPCPYTASLEGPTFIQFSIENRKNNFLWFLHYKRPQFFVKFSISSVYSLPYVYSGV